MFENRQRIQYRPAHRPTNESENNLRRFIVVAAIQQRTIFNVTDTDCSYSYININNNIQE